MLKNTFVHFFFWPPSLLICSIVSHTLLAIQCLLPPVVESPLIAIIEGNHAGQKAVYSCLDGYRLIGSNFSECLTSG